MPDIIQMQSMARSRLDQSKLASFDQEVIEAPTRPLIHQEARFLLVRKGRGEMSIQSRPYKLEPGSLVAVLPWQGGLILVAISMVLTLIAGLIPSRLASKKDPVIALRTE